MARRPKKALIQFLVAAGIAVVLGGVGLLAVFGIIGQLTENNQQTAQRSQQLEEELNAMKKDLDEAYRQANAYMVLQAVRPIGMGTEIDNTMVRAIKVTEGEPKPNYYNALDQVIGHMTTKDIAKGEVLTQANVLKDKDSMAVEPGKRAIAINVSTVGVIAGSVRPGSRVDVLVTFPDEKITRTILQNIKVIALGLQFPKDSVVNNTNAVRGNLVTVEVSPQESELLALANQTAVFHLSLRHLSDDKAKPVPGTDIAELSSGAYSQPRAKAIASGRAGDPFDIPVNYTGNVMGLPTAGFDPNGAAPFTMEIYRGVDPETREFDWTGQ